MSDGSRYDIVSRISSYPREKRAQAMQRGLWGNLEGDACA